MDEKHEWIMFFIHSDWLFKFGIVCAIPLTARTVGNNLPTSDQQITNFKSPNLSTVGMLLVVYQSTDSLQSTNTLFFMGKVLYFTFTRRLIFKLKIMLL